MLKEKFIAICNEKIQRQGIEDLMSWLEKSDFYTAPASTRFHGSYPEGLVEHSLNVYGEALRLLKAYPEIEVPDESVAIAALFHDLCKVNFYTVEQRNRKNETGQWEKYDAYSINERFCFGGHGSKSMFIVQHFMPLTNEEAVAINCHMGAYDNKDVGNAFDQFPLAWIIHVADGAATHIIENKKTK